MDLITAAMAFAMALIALILELWHWRREPSDENRCTPEKR